MHPFARSTNIHRHTTAQQEERKQGRLDSMRCAMSTTSKEIKTITLVDDCCTYVLHAFAATPHSCQSPLTRNIWVWDISKSIHCACEIPEIYYINRNDIKFKLLFIPYSKNYYYPRYLFFSLRLYSIHTKSMIDDLIGM